MAFWCFLYVYQRVAGFFPDFPHTVPGRRTSKGGFCAAQRLQSLRWGKFTLPQAGHSQFPFSPSDQTRYPIRSIPGCWLDWKGLTRHGSRDPIEKSEIANRSSIQSSIQSFLKIQPPPKKKNWFRSMMIPSDGNSRLLQEPSFCRLGNVRWLQRRFLVQLEFTKLNWLVEIIYKYVGLWFMMV